MAKSKLLNRYLTWGQAMTKNKTLVLGICGPVGVGKTLLIQRIQAMLSERYSLATLSDGIFTVKDLNYVPPLMTPSWKSRDFSHGMDRPLLSHFMGLFVCFCIFLVIDIFLYNFFAHIAQCTHIVTWRPKMTAPILATSYFWMIL